MQMELAGYYMQETSYTLSQRAFLGYNFEESGAIVGDYRLIVSTDSEGNKIPGCGIPNLSMCE